MKEQSLTDREIFTKTLGIAISNIIWFSIAAFVIVLITKLWMKLAIVLTVLYLIIIAIDAIWVLVGVTIPGIIVIATRRATVWTLLAAVARLLDAGVGVVLGCYLYWRIF